MARSDFPAPTVRRLSLYLRVLESLAADHVPTVSSGRLGEALKLTDAQVRKDLACFGQLGQPGVGYHVNGLIRRLRRILGTDRVSPTVLVGAGNLGHAVGAYRGFEAKGFRLVGLFDTDPEKVGGWIGDLVIQPTDQLEAVVDRLNIRLAIMTVPETQAQGVADRLVGAGIRGILNFAPVHVRVPAAVTVRNLDVAAELEQLSFQTHADATIPVS